MSVKIPEQEFSIHEVYDRELLRLFDNRIRAELVTEALIAENKSPKVPDEDQMAINRPWITKIREKLDKKAG